MCQNSIFLFIAKICVSRTFIMEILCSTTRFCARLRVIGLQFKVDFSTFANSTLPKGICKRKRGKIGGVKQRLRKLGCKPYLPSLILGNVRSLHNEMEELCANVKYANEFRSTSLMCFTDTLLSENVADSHVNIEGFSIFCANRTNDSGKLKGGGLCIFVND